MTRGNQSHITEFLLLGLTSDPKQVWLLPSFLVMYLVNVGGNSVIIAAIRGDVRLHTPMYFFLSNLSFVDICFTNVIVPQMLANMQSKSKRSLHPVHLTQMYFFVACAITDSFLLGAMALDRYVAICHPLHYTTTMNPRRCFQLVTASWLVSHLHSLTHTILMAHLSFCGPNVIHHFFCDVQPLLMLSCSDTSVNELLAFTEGLLGDHESLHLHYCLLCLYHPCCSESLPGEAGTRSSPPVGPSHGCGIILWDCHLSVHQAPPSTYSVTRTGWSLSLHCGNPHAEPFYL